MNAIIAISFTLLTFIIMEGFTWWLHKYVMHGFLWYLHKDHHHKNDGFFEKNDAFFIVFAIPSWLFIMLGVMNQAYWSIGVGAGFTLYGLAYFFVHDIVIHQRFKWFSRSNNDYIRTIRWAHKMHHKHTEKKEGESFGFLWVAKKYWDKVKDDNRRNGK
jgi:beta-carotene 3-hydroxylase